jgi:hypothetical protein
VSEGPEAHILTLRVQAAGRNLPPVLERPLLNAGSCRSIEVCAPCSARLLSVTIWPQLFWHHLCRCRRCDNVAQERSSGCCTSSAT